MMMDMVRDQFGKLLDGLGPDPWPALTESGFLDLLRSETDGGVDAGLEILADIAFLCGERLAPEKLVATIISRIRTADALAIDDPEASLIVAGSPQATARALCAAAAATEMAGLIAGILDMTVEFAATRKQFGRAIGSFQSIQHQIAVLAEHADAARIGAFNALQGSLESLDIQRVAAAKILSGEAAVAAIGISHAVHGAIGMSDEHLLGRYTRRLRRLRGAHGGEAFWADRLGRWALAQRDDDMMTLTRSLTEPLR